MVKKLFVINEEEIDVFDNIFYIPKIENLSFHISHVRIIGSMECGKTRNEYFHESSCKKINLKKYCAEKFSKTTGI